MYDDMAAISSLLFSVIIAPRCFTDGSKMHTANINLEKERKKERKKERRERKTRGKRSSLLY